MVPQVSFDDMASHLQQYRAAVDSVFANRVVTTEECRVYFFRLLLATSKVYLDFLLTLEALQDLYTASDRKAKSTLISSDLERWKLHRTRYVAMLQGLPLNAFTPSRLATLTFGWSHEDFSRSLELHVPEIYEETFRLESHIQRLQISLTRVDLTFFEVAFSHLGENHAPFLLPVLQDLCMEANWAESQT